MFSLQIFSVVLHGFLEIVFFVFLNIVAMQTSLYSQLEFAYFATLIFQIIFKLLLMTTVCGRFVSTLKRTGEVIYDEIAKTEDEEIIKEVS